MSIQDVNDAITRISNVMQAISTSFQECVNAMEEIWRKLNGIEEVIFESLNINMTPRQYGLSLIRRKGTDNYVASQGYIRPFQRNLPYQRRCYC